VSGEPDLYKVDINRMSFAEFRRHAPSPLAGLTFWLAGKLRLLRTPVPIVYQARSFAQSRVDLDVLSYEAMAALRPYLAGFERLGYAPVFYVQLDARADPTLADSAGCYLRHASGESFALVAHLSKWRAPAFRVADAHTVCWVGASLASGSKLVVTDTAAYLDPAPPVRVRVVPGGTPAEMHAAIRAEIAACGQRDPVVAFEDADRLAESLDREERRTTEHRAARGLYRPMPRHELDATRDLVARARSAAVT
jgi:hypothetical protein